MGGPIEGGSISPRKKVTKNLGQVFRLGGPLKGGYLDPQNSNYGGGLIGGRITYYFQEIRCIDKNQEIIWCIDHKKIEPKFFPKERNDKIEITCFNPLLTTTTSSRD